MSIEVQSRRLTAIDIAGRKGGEPIVSLTSYHAHTAAIIDPLVDFILVGDSLGMVMHGLESTIPVTVDMMVLQGRAVMRGSKRALVVVDLPFGSYEESPAAAFRTASRVLKETGCGAVKLEGGRRMAETIRFLSERGVPVMGHVGLTPQAVNILGGYGVRGKSAAEARSIVEDAEAVARAGAFALVIEGVMEPIAIEITEKVACPTIGIGASAQCDGQVLVAEDMLGLFDRTPKFVKRFGAMQQHVEEAVKKYAEDVRARTFPSDEQLYRPD